MAIETTVIVQDDATGKKIRNVQTNNGVDDVQQQVVTLAKSDGTLDPMATETTLAALNAKLPALVGGRIPVDGSGPTQPVSAVSLPLPAGAATEATLGLVNAQLGVGAASLAKVEDAVAASGDVGIMLLGVRNDSAVVKTNANGDYSGLAVDSAGRLIVTAIDGSFPASNSNSSQSDGHSVTLGSTTDAAVDTNANGSINAHIRGLVKILASVLNATLGALTVVEKANTAGGWTPGKYISAASANQDQFQIKASAGQLGVLVVSNINAAVRYLKLYNVASPTSASTPVQTYAIPGNTAAAGFCINLGLGLEFTTVITGRITTGVADNDAVAVAANDIVVNYGFK